MMGNGSSSCLMTPTDRCGFIYGEKGYICVTNINNPEAIKIYDVEHNLIKEVEIPKQVTGYEYKFQLVLKRLIKMNQNVSNAT